MPAGTSFIISEGMISSTIKEVETAERNYICIDIRNHLLHAVHPLGWMREINLKVDGKTIPKQNIYFVLRGQWVNVEFMHTIQDIYWYIAEPAQLFIAGLSLSKGEHEIEFELVASQLEVSTILDVKEIWDIRRQTITQTVTL